MVLIQPQSDNVIQGDTRNAITKSGVWSLVGRGVLPSGVGLFKTMVTQVS